jgi:hypothetical protein
MLIPQSKSNLSYKQAIYMDFLASGSIDTHGKKLSREDFARSIGVSRKTLYRWQANIPDFWAGVHTRSMELLSEKVPKVIESMYQKALLGDVHAARLILNQADVLKPQPSNESQVLYSQINIMLGNDRHKEQIS